MQGKFIMLLIKFGIDCAKKLTGIFNIFYRVLTVKKESIKESN